MLLFYNRENSLIMYCFSLFPDFTPNKTNGLLALASQLRIRQETGIFLATVTLSKKVSGGYSPK